MQLHQLFYLFSDAYQVAQLNLLSLLFVFLFYQLHSLSWVIDWTASKIAQYHLNRHQKKSHLNHNFPLRALSKLFQLSSAGLGQHRHHLHYHLQSPFNYQSRSRATYHFVEDYLLHQITPRLIIFYFSFLLAYLLLQVHMAMENHFAIFIRSSILGFLWLMFQEYKLGVDYNVLFRSRNRC